MNMWFKKIRRFARNKKAISGLETAIVLIAFVIVASAFAYAVLNMGFLATQKSQQVVLGGLQGASAAIVVDGPVYGYGNNDPLTSGAAGTNYTMHIVIFWLKVSSGADSVDLNVNKTTIGFQNPRGVWPNIFNTGGAQLVYSVSNTYYYAGTGTNTAGTISNSASAATAVWEVGSGNLLKTNDKVRVTVDLTLLGMCLQSPAGTAACTGNTHWNTNGLVLQNEQFKIIVKPPYGSVLDIVRNAPAQITQTNDLT
jgi:flagellin FlaB